MSRRKQTRRFDDGSGAKEPAPKRQQPTDPNRLQRGRFNTFVNNAYGIATRNATIVPGNATSRDKLRAAKFLGGLQVIRCIVTFGSLDKHVLQDIVGKANLVVDARCETIFALRNKRSTDHRQSMWRKHRRNGREKGRQICSCQHVQRRLCHEALALERASSSHRRLCRAIL